MFVNTQFALLIPRFQGFCNWPWQMYEHIMLRPLPYLWRHALENTIQIKAYLDVSMKLIRSIDLCRSKRINFIEASK